MKRKRKRNTDCRECGEKGIYRYSLELATFLGLGRWEGTYICDRCMTKLNRRYALEKEGKDDSIYSMLV